MKRLLQTLGFTAQKVCDAGLVFGLLPSHKIDQQSLKPQLLVVVAAMPQQWVATQLSIKQTGAAIIGLTKTRYDGLKHG
jgi:hypothetical protein